MSQTDTLRAAFKENLTKLNEIDTRTAALRDIQILLSQNKTTNNLRVWLSVLSQNRKKHSESQIQVIALVVKLYGKGLLDPKDKIPSIEKTVFRITELLIKFFSESHQNVQLACQAAWLELYESTLMNEPAEIKKKLLYNNLEAIINGGGGKVAQVTSQIIVEGLLQRSLSSEDLEFFKQISKRTLILFLKTEVNHPSTLVCLQTILSFFNIMNLLQLADKIVSKILTYVASAQANSIGYKIKGQACNCFSVIGQQIDSNGVPIYERIHKILSDMATDKVWAIQAPGRRALGIWKAKKQEWDRQFLAKNEKISQEVEQIRFQNPLENLQENISQYPRSYQGNWNNQRKSNTDVNFYPDAQVPQRPITKTDYASNQNNKWVRSNDPREQDQPNRYISRQPDTYLHKNTGMGGGNNAISVQDYYERQRSQDTYQRKMQQLKKSVYNPKSQIQFEDTVVLEDNRPNKKPNNSSSKMQAVQPKVQQAQEEEGDEDFIEQWENVLFHAEKQNFEESAKILLQMDDDIYFLRYFLRYSSKLLNRLTRPTSNKVLKKMLQIKKTHFMEQILFKMVAESIKAGVGPMLANAQNIKIQNHLEQAKKTPSLQEIVKRLSTQYEDSLQG